MHRLFGRRALRLLCSKVIPITLLLPVQLIYSQGPEPSSGQAISSSPVWRSEHASHLLGLMELAPNLKGSLALSPNGVVFTTPSGETTIEHGHVLAVSAGNVRMEMGVRQAELAGCSSRLGAAQFSRLSLKDRSICSRWSSVMSMTHITEPFFCCRSQKPWRQRRYSVCPWPKDLRKKKAKRVGMYQQHLLR